MSVERNIAYDVVKGLCVIGMIIHHTIDYYDPGNQAILFVRFITGSFVFISGYIITMIYSMKYDIATMSGSVGWRLQRRGLKLLMLFTVLNIGIGLIIKRTIHISEITVPDLLNALQTIYISGDFTVVAFELLVPIAYVYLALGMFVTLFRQFRVPVLMVAPVLTVVCLIFFFNQVGGYNLRFFTIGMIGALIGLIPVRKITGLARHIMFVGISVFAIQMLIVSIPLYYPVYILTVLVNILFLYGIGTVVAAGSRFSKEMQMLGLYSLIGYLGQIAILQVLSRLLKPEMLYTGRVILPCLITLILTILCVRILDVLISRSRVCNSMYRLVFA